MRQSTTVNPPTEHELPTEEENIQVDNEPPSTQRSTVHTEPATAHQKCQQPKSPRPQAPTAAPPERQTPQRRVTRSGRSIQPPRYLKDFEMTAVRKSKSKK